MKNIYVIYGKPASGKSHFVRNFIYNKKTDLYEYSRIDRMNFINKYADIENYYKRYNNLIIDDILSDKLPKTVTIPGDEEYPEEIVISVRPEDIANTAMYYCELLEVERCFNNLILICHNPSDVERLVARLVSHTRKEEKPEVRYIKIEKNLEG